MKGEKVTCLECGLYCGLKKEDGRIICMGNGICRYNSGKKLKPSNKHLERRTKK